MRKAIAMSLVLGAFAAMAMAQAAFGAHERPAAAGVALRGSIVPVSNACTVPNRFHEAPVSFQSCGTTTSSDTSPLLQPTSGVGGSTSVYYVKPVNLGTANVDIEVSSDANGVKCEGGPWGVPASPDPQTSGCNGTELYNGRTLGESSIRASDHKNCPTAACALGAGTQSATVVDFNFTFRIPCGNKASPVLAAGRCMILSSANTELPGAVTNGDLSVIQIQSVVAKDPGPDGVAGSGCPLLCGTGDEQLASQQGLYIP